MVGANCLNPIFVEFANADTQTLERLNKIHEKLKLESRQISNRNTPFEQAKCQLQARPDYQIFREELLENFYWKASDYQIELSINYNDNETELCRYQLSLNYKPDRPQHEGSCSDCRSVCVRGADMRGNHRVIVQNKHIRYDFEIRRNITVVRGDSATGKTALVDMVREYYENGSASAVELVCDKQCTVLDGRTCAGQLSMMKDSIVFIDEGNEFVMSDEFAQTIQNTDNYYVIVTREGITSLPYSVEEIYGIRDSGKYGTLKRTYNELCHLFDTDLYQTADNYQAIENSQAIRPQRVITEDSHSGYQFFQGICERNGRIICTSVQGKSNIFAAVIKQLSERATPVKNRAKKRTTDLQKNFPMIKNWRLWKNRRKLK